LNQFNSAEKDLNQAGHTNRQYNNPTLLVFNDCMCQKGRVRNDFRKRYMTEDVKVNLSTICFYLKEINVI